MGPREGLVSEPFTTSHGTTVTTDMMSYIDGWALVGDDFQGAIVKYPNSPLQLIVVMPKRWNGFQWDEAMYRRVRSSAANMRMCDLAIPKLHLRSRHDLGAVMSKLGVDPLDSQLQQAVLASGEPLHLDALVQEASVQINEMPPGSDPLGGSHSKLLGEPLYLLVDKPFYFVVVEPGFGLILLMGQVTDPTADLTH